MKNIEILPAYHCETEIRELFSEYTDMLIAGDSSFRKYLDIQNYEEELAHLENKYGPPYGRLYLARVDGAAAGCIGLRKMDGQNCEMKRLYVRPQFRGNGLGALLVQKVIADARSVGYSAMFLDTLPFLESAIHMYKKLGFYLIDCYNNSPMSNAVYMKLDLQ